MSPVTDQQPKKILLIIRSLHIGGAERQVVSLAKTISALGTEVHVALKVSGGPLENDLANIPDVTLHHIKGSGLTGRFQYFLRLRTVIKQNQFDAVYGFMPVPNLTLLVARTIRNRPIIAWGVRSSGVDPSQYGERVKWTMRLEKWLSRFADRVITNSRAALDEYRLNNYPFAKLSHIPNAIDVDRFKPDPGAREKLGLELGISQSTPLIGLFARIHPMKDHLTFLRAAKILIEDSPNVQFICAGEVSTGYETYEKRIRTNATELGLDDHIMWIGPRRDPEYLMAACDLTTLTSDSGEGFPNSVAESLACSTPCVVTDVGDAALIVNNPEAVVPRSNPEELVIAWQAILDRLEKSTGDITINARASIVDRYSPEQIAGQTLSELSERPN
jgi:glycosyltransferase involved in cell wall biosynthesis